MSRMLGALRLKRAMVVATVAGVALSSAILTTAASASVKLPKSGVEKPPSATLSETGSTLLYPLFNLWSAGYSESYPGVSIQTAGTGSGTGISDAANGTADIGASDAYLSPAQVNCHADALKRTSPLAISSQLVVYNVSGVTGHLKLSGKLLSQIYQGKVTTWNDPSIAAANPGVTLPSTPIVTLHRSDSSGDTFLFTSFLSKADANGWGKSIAFNTTVPWPNAPGNLGETGNSGMVTGCKATPGCIAYVGISYLTQALQAGPRLPRSCRTTKGKLRAPPAADHHGQGADLVHQVDAGQWDHLPHLRPGGHRLPDRELRVRRRERQASPSSSTAKAINASVLEWATVNAWDGNSPTYLSQVELPALPAGHRRLSRSSRSKPSPCSRPSPHMTAIGAT